MQPKFLEKRVEILERSVDGLSELPARVEAIEGQILQLRTEMRGEFSAVRQGAAAFEGEMRAFQQDVRKEFVQVRAEMKAGDGETRTLMRVLHEDAMSRIGVLAEAVEDTRQQVRTGQINTARLKNDVGVLRFDVGVLKTDVAALKTDVAVLKTDVAALKEDVTERLSAIAGQLTSLMPRKRR